MLEQYEFRSTHWMNMESTICWIFVGELYYQSNLTRHPMVPVQIYQSVRYSKKAFKSSDRDQRWKQILPRDGETSELT